MKNPIITLLTDFGTKDYYVASMKGVILSINPRCALIDITHEVSPYHIEEGAFILACAYKTFPKGTIHLSVVDPGVGSSRRPILFVTTNYFFVGPDNGLFSLAAQREKVKQVVLLSNTKYFSPRISNTFHGRDIFAPVAAHLSLGVKPKAFGNVVDSWKKLSFRKPREKAGVLKGEVLHIDDFGNLISNINQEELFRFAKDYPFMIKVGKRTIHGLKKGYWAGQKRELMALFGSTGFLEISIREGNAQKMLRVKKGDRVIVSIVRRQ
ncbi:MAG: SAM-dependent chlorinase/fluorinase [Thermodesulfobacteriota bacterium]